MSIRLTSPRALLFAILALLSCGGLIGGSFQPARIAVLIAVPLILGLGSKKADHSGLTVDFVLMGVVWIGWGAVSLCWAQDRIAGLNELAALLLGLTTAFTVMRLARSDEGRFGILRFGWATAFALTLPMACVEIFADTHFGGNEGGQIAGGTGASVVYAATSFGNRNDYCAFITLCFPFLLLSFSSTRSWTMRIAYGGLVGAAVALVVLNASRLGMATLAIGSLVSFTLNMSKPRFSWRALNKFLLIATIFSALAIWMVPKLEYTKLRFESLSQGHDESIGERSGLTLAGLDMLWNTYGFGVGAGSFPTAITKYAVQPETYAIGNHINPHNLWIEVFSQYGLIAGSLFVYWLLRCAVSLNRMRRYAIQRGDRSAQYSASCGLAVLAGLPTNAVMGSHYLGFTHLWAMLGSVAGITFAARTIGSNSSLPKIERSRKSGS